jgi:hypothetical protein
MIYQIPNPEFEQRLLATPWVAMSELVATPCPYEKDWRMIADLGSRGSALAIVEERNRQAALAPSCLRCAIAKTRTVFTWDDGIDGREYCWDVDRAKALVYEGLRAGHARERGALSREIMEAVARANETDPAHIWHVNPALPGIAVSLHGMWVLIDGNHRSRLNLALGVDYEAWLLTEAEAAACLLTAADALEVLAHVITRSL